MERVLNTIAYFDTMHQATHCRVPTLVSLGEKDPAARPENVEAIYAALPGKKRLVRYDWGHDWHPAMIETNRAWLKEHMP
jgi:cephalosporin-C deacetylase